MLPLKFKERMKSILKDSYFDFERALTEEKAKKGFRVNGLKCNSADFAKNCKFPIKKLSYVNDGFLITDEISGIGNTPEHASGQIYVQDPGAMASAAALDITPGMWVADLCAAPGGKSTQVASMLKNEGFLLSNEYVPKRAKILVSNFERMGITCGVVTSLDTDEIANLFDSVFDVVIADAPCSGEGMFRKDVPAIEEWSEDNITICQKRQTHILNNAAKIVKTNGHLLYSTCTYSLEENEMVVDEFLENHPEFELCEVKDELKLITDDGVEFEGAKTKELKKCRRFYPHKADGEGQFLALMRKKDGSKSEILFKDAAKQPSKDEIRIVEDFFKANLTERPRGRIIKHGENLVLASYDCPLIPKSVFSAGVLIGEIRGKILFPSHQFFSCYGNIFLRRQELSEEDAALYLSGSEVKATDFNDSGFAAVLYNGSALGGGKASGSIIKNHYPKGLRIR